MPKNTSTIFTCSNCDAQFPKWSGRCLECGSWGTLKEEVRDEHQAKRTSVSANIGAAEVLDLRTVIDTHQGRFSTGLGEFDRVLGGGIVPGSLVLIGGEPGIGKSTLLAQAAEGLAKNKSVKGGVLYISGEESALQVKARLERLGCDLANIKFGAETNIERIAAAALKEKPALLIIDSVQTVYSPLLPSEPGSLNQIRAVAVKCLELAKQHGIAVFLIGHITKDGQIAGPKSLEHIVDAVAYLEREEANNYSLLRATKNRFGSANELGVFEMTGTGFKEVADPSQIFLSHSSEPLAGSVVSAVIEGSRPFLINIQALVTKTVFGYPQRRAAGFDLNRLQVLTAVLSKRDKFNLSNYDVILNVVGGVKTSDPALDLAAATAIVSSLLNQPVDQKLIVLGEVGLGGEIRNVTRLEARLKEAERLGFKAAAIPASAVMESNKLEIAKIKKVSEILELVLKKER